MGRFNPPIPTPPGRPRRAGNDPRGIKRGIRQGHRCVPCRHGILANTRQRITRENLLVGDRTGRLNGYTRGITAQQ